MAQTRRPRTPAEPPFDPEENMIRVVRMLMARDGIDGKQLAERMGFRQAQSMYERLNGVTRFSIAELYRMGQLFRVPVAFFFQPPTFGEPDRYNSGYTGEPVLTLAKPDPDRVTA